MTTMQIKLMGFLTLLLLQFFTLANAIPKRDIENLCKETSDASFCLTSLESDPRIAAARDLSDVLLIAISYTIMQVDDATAHLDDVNGQYLSGIGRSRLAVCRGEYGIAKARFNNAWNNCLKKAFRNVNEEVTIGTNAVIICENSWLKGNPIQTSPLTLYDENVFKMSGIIFLLVQKLTS